MISHFRSWKEESASETADDMTGDMSGDMIGVNTWVVRLELGIGVWVLEAAFLGAMYDLRPISFGSEVVSDTGLVK